MPFYTEEERRNALLHLHVNPKSKRVTSTDAAKVLTWRAKQEYQSEHVYTVTSVRKHATKLDVQPATREDGSANHRKNTYDAKKLFEIEINPARTNASRWHTDQNEAKQ